VVLDLATRHPVAHHCTFPVPIAAAIVEAVKASAEKDGMQGLQFKTKTGQTLWDSAWIAGVHCNEEEDDADCGNEGVELPGVEIDEQEEEQLWEDLDENTTANLLDDAESPIQPDPQVDKEDIKEQQEAEEI